MECLNELCRPTQVRGEKMEGRGVEEAGREKERGEKRNSKRKRRWRGRVGKRQGGRRRGEGRGRGIARGREGVCRKGEEEERGVKKKNGRVRESEIRDIDCDVHLESSVVYYAWFLKYLV